MTQQGETRWRCVNCGFFASEDMSGTPHIGTRNRLACVGKFNKGTVEWHEVSEPEMDRLDELAAVIAAFGCYDVWEQLPEKSDNEPDKDGYRSMAKAALRWLDEDARRRLYDKKFYDPAVDIQNILGFERSVYAEEGEK